MFGSHSHPWNHFSIYFHIYLFINKLILSSIFLPHQMSLLVNENDSIVFLLFFSFHTYFIYIFWTYISFSMNYSILNPQKIPGHATSPALLAYFLNHPLVFIHPWIEIQWHSARMNCALTRACFEPLISPPYDPVAET